MSQLSILTLFKALIRGLKYTIDQLERAMKEISA